ncbi:MAG: molybdopterin cofactor-binding domain-containing protein, partial [Pseudomonadota bacterium]
MATTPGTGLLTPSRRSVLKGAASLTFVIGGAGLLAVSADAADEATLEVNPWVAIGSDGVITIVFPATEMGQGSSTALPVILAEELDANWDDVVVEQLDRDDRTYGNPLFGNV